MNRSTHFAIRAATLDDAELICRMHIESIRVNCRADYTPAQIQAWVGPKRPEGYGAAMRRGEAMFVAEAGSEIVGFSALAGNEVQAVYVSPSALRIGVGRALLRAVEAEAQQRGITELQLNSTITALEFYKAQGFVEGARTVYRMGGVDIPCIHMTKALSNS